MFSTFVVVSLPVRFALTCIKHVVNGVSEAPMECRPLLLLFCQMLRPNLPPASPFTKVFY